MIQKAYRIAIAYFTLFTLFLLYTIIALFEEKIGFTLESIGSYYGEKSIEGLLEIAVPHFMAMGIFVMVLTHFFLFTKLKQVYKIITFYFTTTFILIVASFFKLYFLKLFTLLLFIIITTILALLLLVAALKNLR